MMGDSDEDDPIFTNTRRHVIESLKARLQARICQLDQDGLEPVHTEIRRQMAECVVEGHLTVAADLYEMFIDFLQTREYARKL